MAHYLEEDGLPTTEISLVRFHTEAIRPPRAVWVPFDFGRPLGIPNDPAFQKKVMLQALKLLEAPSGPILEDFPEEAPDAENEVTVLACPVSFPEEDAGLNETEKLCAAFKEEVLAMRSWYDIAVEKRGRTTVGTSGIGLDDLPGFLCAFARGEEPEVSRTDITLPNILKLAVEDLKAFYFEGITAQPGQSDATHYALAESFWQDTWAGKIIRKIKEATGKSENRQMQIVGRALIVPSRVDL